MRGANPKQSNLFSPEDPGNALIPSKTQVLKVNINPWEVTPGGENPFEIGWDFYKSPFGEVLMAATSKGICFLAFSDDRRKALQELNRHFPGIPLANREEAVFENARLCLSENFSKAKPIALHLRGTPFQLKVWERLLQVPLGQTITYGTMALEWGNINTARAIGGAVGSNKVAFLIPCHRVVQASGEPGHYRWGAERKKEILRWELKLREGSLY